MLCVKGTEGVPTFVNSKTAFVWAFCLTIVASLITLDGLMPVKDRRESV